MQRGRLLVIATPIGNLEDLSPRALRALKSCDLLLCEDTRHTQKLLTHFGVQVRVDSYHEHNEREKALAVIEQIESGRTIGLVSDAGTPTLSDPGYTVIHLARERGIPVEPLPGPFAAAVALTASGLPPVPFTFFGFTPHRRGDRIDFYREILRHGHTAIVYESPMRIEDSLQDALSVFGDIPITLGREMTKMHEEFLNGSISEVSGLLAARGSVRGEMTVVFSVSEVAPPPAQTSDLTREFAELRDQGMKRTDAIKLLADRHSLSKRELYQQLLEKERTED